MPDTRPLDLIWASASMRAPLTAHAPVPPIPLDTARAAEAAHDQSDLFVAIGDQLTTLLEGIHLDNGSPAGAPSRLGKPSLALVTYFQYLEKLPDRQAVDASGTRVDWKYALHLSLSHPGLSPTALCDFRQSLFLQPDRLQEFQRLLDRLHAAGYAPEGEGPGVEALCVLAEVCARTRLDWVLSSMRHALQALATQYPDWLRDASLPHWYARYQRTSSQSGAAQSVDELRALTQAIGEDIRLLLEATERAGRPELASLFEVQSLHQTCREQYCHAEGNVMWRSRCCFGCTVCNPPSDPDLSKEGRCS